MLTAAHVLAVSSSFSSNGDGNAAKSASIELALATVTAVVKQQ
jgi:hypothetical protein